MQTSCLLTIFTATYNRGHLIPHLYNALLRQENFDFEWLVIDDGSTDHTPDLFDNWCKLDNPFPIRYYRQENRGLIRALNRGIELAQGEYFAKIDSDDYVVDHFTKTVSQWIEEIRTIEGIYGVSGLRITPDGIPLKGTWPTIPTEPGYIDATDLERSRYNLDADMSEAWNTNVLRQYPFPVWEGEKFAPEQIILHEIARNGWKIRWFPVPLTICEYQEGGLTRGSDKLLKANPMGYAMMYNHKLLLNKDFLRQFYNSSQMIALSFYAGHLEYLKESNNKWMTALAFPVGILLGLRRKYQFSKL